MKRVDSLAVLRVTVKAHGISGCASERMLKAEAPPTAADADGPTKRRWCFRTSSFGERDESSVYEISQDGEPELIGMCQLDRRFLLTTAASVAHGVGDRHLQITLQ